MSKLNKKEMVELEKRTAEQKRRLEELREKLATQRAQRVSSSSWSGSGGGGAMNTYTNYTINTSASPSGGNSQWYNTTGITSGSFTYEYSGTPCTICGCSVLDRKLHEKWHAEIQKVATEQAVTELQEMIQDIIELSAPE